MNFLDLFALKLREKRIQQKITPVSYTHLDVYKRQKHTSHKAFIEPCLELQHLLQPALVVGDVVAVFLGKCLIDAGLVNAGQQRLQRSNIADIGFQAVPHTEMCIRDRPRAASCRPKRRARCRCWRGMNCSGF